MTLDELKTIIDRWEDCYITGSTDAQLRLIEAAITAPASLVVQLDGTRQKNLRVMRDGYGPYVHLAHRSAS